MRRAVHARELLACGRVPLDGRRSAVARAPQEVASRGAPGGREPIVRRAVRLALGLAVLAALCPMPGCAARSESAASLERALLAHRAADEALDRGDLDTARSRLLELARAESVAGLAGGEARALRADALYRLAELELAAARPARALGFAEQGLTLGGADLFAANLLVSRGRALERLGRELEAVESYHRALLINERLLGEALDAAGRKPS
ncbi:MAG: hypothetical protein JXR96_17010 [Deltaproteobacteria bacterium]|nr:hypothetical protein [Deltaproteobacteria bacterium]